MPVTIAGALEAIANLALDVFAEHGGGRHFGEALPLVPPGPKDRIERESFRLFDSSLVQLCEDGHSSIVCAAAAQVFARCQRPSPMRVHFVDIPPSWYPYAGQPDEINLHNCVKVDRQRNVAVYVEVTREHKRYRWEIAVAVHTEDPSA